MAQNTRVGFSGKKSKEAVNYRNAEKCGTCDYHQNGKCKRVEGGISPDTVCDMWEMRGIPTGIDGDFYTREYNKDKGNVIKEIKNLAKRL